MKYPLTARIWDRLWDIWDRLVCQVKGHKWDWDRPSIKDGTAEHKGLRNYCWRCGSIKED